MKVKFGTLTEVSNEDLKLLKENPQKFWHGIDSIYYCAFGKDLNLTEITIPGTVKVIRGGFSFCKNLEKVTIMEGVKAIEERAFCGCSKLKEIILPNTIQIIGHLAFSECKNLEKINLPDSVKTINSEAFTDCKSLKEIVIPANIEFLSDTLFARCENLKVIFKDKKILSKEQKMIVDGIEISWPFKKSLDGFNFDSFEINGDEVTFIRNIEKQEEKE